MTQSLERRTAWRDIDVMLLALVTVLGVGSWITASVGVGYAKTANGEIAWANLGVVGLIIFGAGNALWLLRGRRAIGARRASLVRLEPVRSRASAVMAPEPPTAPPHSPAGLVRVQGGSLLHEASCPLVAGKTVERVEGSPSSVDVHCRVCSP